MTPWEASRPPEPGDTALVPGADVESSVTTPSDHPDVGVRALQDLTGWVEHPLPASTALARLLTSPGPRSSLRCAAVWAVAPDCCVLVESHIWVSPADQLDIDVARGSRLPDQQYLRLGEVSMTPSLSYRGIGSRYYEMALEGGSANPSAYATALAYHRVLSGGVAWQDAELYPAGHPIRSIDRGSLDAMAAVLHLALDGPQVGQDSFA